MTRLDGRTQRTPLQLDADVVIVGSGPAGCAVARHLAAHGSRVLVVEAGPDIPGHAHPLSAFEAMAGQYRQMGTSVVLGATLMPYVQGRRVGGSGAINGAICWRLPRDLVDAWVAADPALADALPWEELEEVTDTLEARLGVAPTEPAIAGRKSALMARGAEALGLDHRPIRRNVRGCQGLGRCLQGCPIGAKQSADVTLLADALADGAVLLHDTEVLGIDVREGRATGLRARTAGGAAVTVRADHVVVAASAIQSPVLLLRSGLRQGPVGHHFQCHPGVSLLGRFPDPVRSWEGATQGHEVTGLRHEGLKLETLGFGPGVLAGRLHAAGRPLAEALDALDHWTDWGAAVRSTTHGRVRQIAGRPVVTWSPGAEDVRLFRRGLRVMGDLMFAAGATEVLPAVRGFDAVVRDSDALARLETEGPRTASAYAGAITHMFGSCRMGSDPARAVVRPDFRHHAVDRLWVADSSVFPTNLGVNPQVPIMAMATLCARRICAA